MPGKLKVKILAGRNLPVMDRAGDTTDAFVEIKFGGVTHKTDICKKSLNPHWNSAEWYRFEVDESELQDEPLQLRLLDHDTYSANDTIGKVVISLLPLISRDPNTHSKYSPTGSVMSGWVPVFDTMHGLRGELNIIVKVELFSDYNKYKTSSCGVQFFHCSVVPPGYKVVTIHGFVEELVVNDDPEYQWIDKIRTPRASNEARQTTFIKLSNQVQRLVGVKAADLGANAVIAYNQAFDMEGEAGVVARAIGTAVTIEKIPVTSQPINVPVCNQQQLKKYLDILTTDNENITDLNEYFQTHQEELQKLMHILHPKLSPNFLEEDNDDDSIMLGAKTESLSQEEYQQNIRHVIDDQNDQNKYLYCNDRDEDTSISPMKKVRKFRPNFFSRRFRSQRSNKSDKDSISIKSNSSDASRISLAEIKNEFKKFKRLKKPKFRSSKNDEEGIGMASILARSVIHVHSSLARIAETQDSEHSPCSTLRRTSESEPTVHISDEERIEPPIAIHIEETKPSQSKVLPQSHFSSLRNLNTELKVTHRKMSISCPNTPSLERKKLLKLPGEEGYYGSLSSALSGESSDIYSSSEDDDESSDLKTESDKFMETPQTIVQSVLKQELQSAAISKIGQQIDDIDCKDALEKENNQNVKPKHSSDGDLRELAEQPKTQELALPEDDINAGPKTAPIPTNSHQHYFKFHNPFSHKKSSLSEPSSPTDKKPKSLLPPTRNIVFRSSKRLKAQLSKFANSSKIKSLSHYSLLPKKKNTDSKPVHHSSATEIGPKRPSRETVLGSPFMSYSDLLSLDKEHDFKRTVTSDARSPVRMYIGSEPVSRMSLSGPSSPKSLDFIDHDTKPHTKEKSAIKPTGLLHTAMETILLDRVQSLLIPATPDVGNKEEKKFFDDVNEKLGKVEEMRKEQEDVEVNKDNLKKLVRQNSIHSSLENLIPKSLSKERKSPVLQHFHPIMSGPIHPKLSHLETIPSLPETSFDREFSIDSQSELDSTQSLCENLVPKIELTNIGDGVVCDNTHAVCGGNFPRAKGTEKGSPRHSRQENGPTSAGTNVNTPPVGGFRRSSDSDLSLTHKGNYPVGGAVLRSSMHPNNIDMLEYPFLTMTEYPIGFVKHIAGSVFARSVKLIDGDADVTTRTAWWSELRTELRSHARALKCNSVITYAESVSICEDVCILSVSGTAAIINLECDFSAQQAEGTKSCALTHLNVNCPQYSCSECGICGNGYVCNVLLATCNLPQYLDAHPVTTTITAAATRARRTSPQGEASARDLSDQLPFLEYELHKLLLAKLRMQGANSIFNLHTQVTIGERYVSALASGTAVKLMALPSPTTPLIKAADGDKAAAELQKALIDTFTVNKSASGYDTDLSEPKVNGLSPTSNKVESAALDLCSDKDACVLEIDETEDVETAKALIIKRRPIPILNSSSDIKPKLDANPHAFVQVWRGKYLCGNPLAERQVSRVLDGVYFKLRTMRPCALTPVRFQLDYAEEDIQLLITGAAIPLMEPYGGPENGTRIKKASSLTQSIAKNMGRINKQNIRKQIIETDDIIFDFEDDKLLPHIPDKPPHPSELKQKHAKGNHPSIALSPLPYIHGATRQTWICALRLLFVRETTSVKEIGGLNGFMHRTMSEVLAIVRAYTFALGGNTLTSFFITQLLIQHNTHKNQGQCILSVGGDVMHVTH